MLPQTTSNYRTTHCIQVTSSNTTQTQANYLPNTSQLPSKYTQPTSFKPSPRELPPQDTVQNTHMWYVQYANLAIRLIFHKHAIFTHIFTNFSTKSTLLELLSAKTYHTQASARHIKNKQQPLLTDYKMKMSAQESSENCSKVTIPCILFNF